MEKVSSAITKLARKYERADSELARQLFDAAEAVTALEQLKVAAKYMQVQLDMDEPSDWQKARDGLRAALDATK